MLCLRVGTESRERGSSMAHNCKVARNGKRNCHVHGLPLSSVNHLFADIILGEYQKKELREYHDAIRYGMLDKSKATPMDDA